MKYTRFEDVPVWQAAARLGQHVLVFAEEDAFRAQGDLRDQIQRAALSVSNNIAEGQGSTAELIDAINISRGSAAEVRSMLRIMHELPHFAPHRAQITDLIALCENISRQACAWAQSLQNSGFKGARHVTNEVREQNHRKARAAAFLQELDRVRLEAEEKRAATAKPTQPSDPA